MDNSTHKYFVKCIIVNTIIKFKKIYNPRLFLCVCVCVYIRVLCVSLYTYMLLIPCTVCFAQTFCKHSCAYWISRCSLQIVKRHFQTQTVSLVNDCIVNGGRSHTWFMHFWLFEMGMNGESVRWTVPRKMYSSQLWVSNHGAPSA